MFHILEELDRFETTYPSLFSCLSSVAGRTSLPHFTMPDSVITVEYKGRVAVLTIRNEAKLNALSQLQYYEIAKKLREIATHDEVFVTVLLAKGRFFSAYAPRLHSPTQPSTACARNYRDIHIPH